MTECQACRKCCVRDRVRGEVHVKGKDREVGECHPKLDNEIRGYGTYPGYSDVKALQTGELKDGIERGRTIIFFIVLDGQALQMVRSLYDRLETVLPRRGLTKSDSEQRNTLNSVGERQRYICKQACNLLITHGKLRFPQGW